MERRRGLVLRFVESLKSRERHDIDFAIGGGGEETGFEIETLFLLSFFVLSLSILFFAGVLEEYAYVLCC